MRYKHGYYEDTDLAFAVTKAGLDIIYQPLAVVYHRSGSTFGKDSDFKLKLMAENKKKFITKWSEALQYLCYRPEMGTWRSAHHRVLWIEDNFTGKCPTDWWHHLIPNINMSNNKHNFLLQEEV
jgi:GT2 family glycosyltransferase